MWLHGNDPSRLPGQLGSGQQGQPVNEPADFM